MLINSNLFIGWRFGYFYSIPEMGKPENIAVHETENEGLPCTLYTAVSEKYTTFKSNTGKYSKNLKLLLNTGV